MHAQAEGVLAGFERLRELLLGNPLALPLEEVNRTAQGLIRQLEELSRKPEELSEEEALRLNAAAKRVQALFRAAAGFVLSIPVPQQYNAEGVVTPATRGQVQVEG